MAGRPASVACSASSGGYRCDVSQFVDVSQFDGSARRQGNGAITAMLAMAAVADGRPASLGRVLGFFRWVSVRLYE